MAKRYPSKLEHLMTYVSPEPNTGCWLWTGRTDKGGYAMIGFYDKEAYKRGRASKQMRAHVLSYLIHGGTIPEGMELDHLCRVRCCVNPRHLEPVTHAENIRRGMAAAVNGARMRAKTHCPRGHEYTPENTLATQGGRKCRTCLRLFDKIRYAISGKNHKTSGLERNRYLTREDALDYLPGGVHGGS